MAEINKLKLFRSKKRRLSEDTDLYVKDEDKKIKCPVCHKEIKEEDLKNVEYVKTKRQTEIFIHTKCVPKWGKE